MSADLSAAQRPEKVAKPLSYALTARMRRSFDSRLEKHYRKVIRCAISGCLIALYMYLADFKNMSDLTDCRQSIKFFGFSVNCIPSFYS